MKDQPNYGTVSGVSYLFKNDLVLIVTKNNKDWEKSELETQEVENYPNIWKVSCTTGNIWTDRDLTIFDRISYGCSSRVDLNSGTT